MTFGRRSFLKTAGAYAVGTIAESATRDIEANESALVIAEVAETSKRQQNTPSLDTYLARMPALSGVVKDAIGNGKRPFESYSIFLVHHLTAEVVGVIAALRQLGCRDITTVFVGYNHDLETAFRADFDAAPDSELRCYILGVDDSAAQGEPIYVVPRRFIKQPAGDGLTLIDELDGTYRAKRLSFLVAMQALAVPLVLRQFARARTQGRPLLLIEDGGYLAPIMHDAALSQATVSQFRASNLAPLDERTDAVLPSTVAELLQVAFIGSVEHTRSGYDANLRVYRQYGKLAKPLSTIAVSYLKTQVESETVAATILNAIEAVLYSCGVGLRKRRVFVFGSRGNIGRRIMEQLQTGLESPAHSLTGCDLKVNRPDSKEALPSWQLRPSQSSAHGASEVARYVELDSARAADLDLIIGVTGGPTPGHPVLQVQDIITWLLQGHRTELFIASGSTKTAEFSELLDWIDDALRSALPGTQVPIRLGDRTATLGGQPVIDLLSRRRFGTRYSFTIDESGGMQRVRSLVFLEELTPVNFLFYGVPTEIIDVVLAQLISATLTLVAFPAIKLEPRMYAVDYDPEATANVYGSRPLVGTQRFPLPSPA